jgi:sugar transferase (PEP-CTERM/EpsH1 system associated)
MSDQSPLNILILTPSLPYPPNWGFGIRVYQCVRHLARRHRVHLVTYAWPGPIEGVAEDEAEKIASLKALGVCVHTVPIPEAVLDKRRAQKRSMLSLASFQSSSLYTFRMQALIDRLMAEQSFDIVQIESSQLGGYRFRSGPQIVLDEHNIEYELLGRMVRSERQPVRRLYNALEYVKFRREERRCWQRVDACLFTSERECELVRRRLPHQAIAVAPNGVDIDDFRPQEVAIDPDSLVFTGLISYRPNTDAILYFAREVLPRILEVRPQAVFTVVGLGDAEEVYRLAGSHIVVTGSVPDVRPYVARAAAFVVPLRMGSGTRLKVLEGLAMGKPMVSTSLGCEGISVRDGEHLKIADNPAVFAQATLQLMEDASLAAQLGRAGRTLIEREYSWESVVAGIEEFYRRRLLCRTGAPMPQRSVLDRA